MKKIFSFILMLVFICSANQAFCAKNKKSHKHDKMHGIAEQISFLRYQIDGLDKGMNKETIHKIKEWINLLENKLLEKIEHEQKHLEEYENKLQQISTYENTDEETKEEWSENIHAKMQSSTNKINVCQELLQSLDQLKSKIKKH